MTQKRRRDRLLRPLDMQKVEHHAPSLDVKRPPKAKKGEFVRIFDDLTAIWCGPIGDDFIRDRQSSS